MIVLDKVFFSYPHTFTSIFTDFCLSIHAHSWVSIIGPDGSGKTTLAKLIEGSYRPLSGKITVDISHPCSKTVTGYLGGDPCDSLVGTSVEEDLVFGLENLRVPREEMQARVRRALQWTGLAGMEHRLTHTLSGGEQQKLALAAMLALEARVLILDEALAMLDRPIRRSIRRLIGALRQNQGLTIIEITHNLEEALTSERLLFLSKQGIGFDGTPEDFLRSALGKQWCQVVGGLTALREALSGEDVARGLDARVRDAVQKKLNINE